MLLQIALDHPSALGVVERVAPFVDIVEAGTPLVKRFGLSVIPTLRSLAPEAEIFADTKTADGGAKEADMFYDAGADLVTVLASASPNTVAAAADAAAAWGRSLVLDTVGLDDPITWLRSRSIPEGVSHIAIHSSLDDRSKPDFDETAQFKLVAEAAQLGRRVVLAGGITRKTFDHAVQSGADVIVVGREIWGSPNPAEVARMMKESTR